jgi:hypothetical protein
MGGYCTFLGGKLTGSIGDNGFDARARTGERVFGRTDCVAGAPGQPPRCGSQLTPSSYQPAAIFHLGDMFAFMDSLLYPVPGTSPAEFRMQPFFVWYAPRIPHQPLRSPKPIDDYLFGPSGSYPLGGLFNLGALCSGGVCPHRLGDERDQLRHRFPDVRQRVLDGRRLREIRQFLVRRARRTAWVPTARACSTPRRSCTGTWASTSRPISSGTPSSCTFRQRLALPNSKHDSPRTATGRA